MSESSGSKRIRSEDVDLVEVLAAVVRRGHRYLVGRRPLHKRHGDNWEFPGGKTEGGEALEDAVVREFREELDLTVVRVGEVLDEVRDPGSPYLVRFVEVEVEGEPRALEHAELRWATPLELVSMALAPADRTFVERMLGRG